MKTYDTVGLIMAGGQSKRMGQDKALLTCDNRTFMEIAWQTLETLHLNHIFICGEQPDYPSIHDISPFRGPASAIVNAVKNDKISSSDRVIVIPLDMPALTSADLTPLLDTLTHTDVDSVFFKGHPFPCAFKTESLINLLDKDTSIQDISMLKLLTGYLKGHTLPLKDERRDAFININTTSDYEKLKQMLQNNCEKAC